MFSLSFLSAAAATFFGAKCNNIHIVDTHIARAHSAKTDNRPSFQKMIKDSAKKSLDIIIVGKLEFYNGGTLPIGYVIHANQQFQVDPVTAPAVLEAVKLYASGTTMQQLVYRFNLADIRTTRNGKLDTDNITNMDLTGFGSPSEAPNSLLYEGTEKSLYSVIGMPAFFFFRVFQSNNREK